MTSILKNQIIKHLSKFVKNLSPDKINLSTLRGEGELSNLELDEKVLTSLLELPNWLTLDRAWCNRVSIRIPWTKLKSVPIYLSLDEVHVSMGTCSVLRQPASNLKPQAGYVAGGKYGFSDKVVDGVTVSVNSLIVNFKSPAFEASLQFSRILLESSSPTWNSSDLRFSRLKDYDLGLILLFKELQWQTLKLEARSTTIDLSLPPLRLITNQSRCRITIKKRLLDCAVIGCRLVLIMDELLWVLTDAQLSAAVLFLQSLTDLIEQDTLVNQRIKAARKLETLPEYLAQQQQQQRNTASSGAAHKSPSPLNRVFARYDVLETSYHFFSEKIDFHFCDDPGEGRSSHPELKDGGALQLTLTQLQIDFYPYHWAAPEGGGSNRKHWLRYEEGSLSRWVQQGVDQFAKQLLNVDSPVHIKLTRSPAGVATTDGQSTPQTASPKVQTGNSLLQGSIKHQLRQLMSTCLVVRLADFLVYRVTTAKSRQSPKEFIVGDRGRFPLPESMPIVHMELTQFFFPGDTEFPLPQPKLYVQLNPLQINFDGLTILWLHAFVRGLEKTLNAFTPSVPVATTDTAKPILPPKPMLEIHLEALMSRVIFELPGWDRPRSMQLQVSRLVCSNHRSADGGSRADLAACLERIQGQQGGGSFRYSGGGLCFASTFPAREDDLSPISEGLLLHATAPVIPPCSTSEWKRDLLWSKESSQVWFLHMDPFWADFSMVSNQTPRPKAVPFIGTVPVTAWIHPDTDRLYGLLQVDSLISVQLDRAEYVFLLRAMEALKETTSFLDYQEKQYYTGTSSQSVVIGAVIPQLDVSITFPPIAASAQSMDGESPLADTESLYPDTSSMTDLAHLGRPIQQPPNANGESKLRNSHSDNTLAQQGGVAAEPVDERGSVSSLTGACAKSGFILKAQSDSIIDITTASENGSAANDLLRSNGGTGNVRIVTFASDRPPQQPTSQQSAPPFQSGLNSVKRGITNFFMSGVDAALKHNTPQLQDDASDTFSIRSDGSSDSSDNFVVLHSEHGEYQHHDVLTVSRTAKRVVAAPAVVDELEVAVEARADTPTNSENSSAPLTTASYMSTIRNNRDLAVITFHINDLELIQQSVDSSSSLRLQAGHISCNECVSISREEFQSKFYSRSRGWREVPVGHGEENPSRTDHPSIPPLRIRMEQKMDFHPERIDLSSSLREAVAAATEAWIEASLTHLNLSLLFSSVTGLTAFIEDELVAPAVPLFISLRDVECSLIEDRPAIRVGGPPPAPPPPMVIRIKHLLVQRNHAGVVSVGVADSNPVTSFGGASSQNLREAALRSRIEELERENQSLKQRLCNSNQ